MLFGDSAALLATAAAAAYAIAYYLQLSFYREFGLTPDQVGVDKTSALLRLIPAMTVVVAVLGMFAALFQMALMGFRKLRHHTGPRRSAPLAAWTLGVISFTFWTTSVVRGAVPPPWPILLLYSLLMSIPAALALFLVVEEMNPTFVLPRPPARIGVCFVLAWTALSAIVVSGWVTVGAKDLASTGHLSRRFEILGIPLDYATISWLDQNKKPPSIAMQSASGTLLPQSELLVIIGQTSSSYTLYDCHTGIVHMVSASDVVVERAKEPPGEDRQNWIDESFEMRRSPRGQIVSSISG